MSKLTLVIEDAKGKREINIPEKKDFKKGKTGYGYYSPITIEGKEYKVGINIYR